MLLNTCFRSSTRLGRIRIPFISQRYSSTAHQKPSPVKYTPLRNAPAEKKTRFKGSQWIIFVLLGGTAYLFWPFKKSNRNNNEVVKEDPLETLLKQSQNLLSEESNENNHETEVKQQNEKKKEQQQEKKQEQQLEQKHGHKQQQQQQQQHENPQHRIQPHQEQNQEVKNEKKKRMEEEKQSILKALEEKGIAVAQKTLNTQFEQAEKEFAAAKKAQPSSPKPLQRSLPPSPPNATERDMKIFAYEVRIQELENQIAKQQEQYLKTIADKVDEVKEHYKETYREYAKQREKEYAGEILSAMEEAKRKAKEEADQICTESLNQLLTMTEMEAEKNNLIAAEVARKYFEEQLNAAKAEHEQKLKELKQQYQVETKTLRKGIDDIETHVEAVRLFLFDQQELEKLDQNVHLLNASVVELGRMMRSSMGFENEWNVLEKRMDELSASLLSPHYKQTSQLIFETVSKDVVKNGVSDISQLQSRFNAVETAVRTVAFTPPGSQMLGKWFGMIFGKLSMHERIWIKGNDDHSIITRAGYYLYQDDLLNCLKELESLSPESREVSSDFMKVLRDRIRVNLAFDMIQSHIIALSVSLAK